MPCIDIQFISRKMPAEQANLYPDTFYSTPTREAQACVEQAGGELCMCLCFINDSIR